VDNVVGCKEYAAESGSCEGYTLPQHFIRCNPATHYCYNSELCYNPDTPGTCELKDLHSFELDCCLAEEDYKSNKCGKGDIFYGLEINACVDLATRESIDKDKIRFAQETSGGCEACANTEISNGNYCLWFDEMEYPLCAAISEGEMGDGHNMCVVVSSPTTIYIASPATFPTKGVSNDFRLDCLD